MLNDAEELRLSMALGACSGGSGCVAKVYRRGWSKDGGGTGRCVGFGRQRFHDLIMLDKTNTLSFFCGQYRC